MSVNVIDTIKPKNNGSFPVVEAVDVKISDNLRLDAALADKVDKIAGKVLSSNDFTDALKSKLEGLSTATQPDWNQTNSSADNYIKNKPTLATVAVSGSYTDLANRPTVDSELSSTSQNAVQNKAVHTALASKVDTTTYNTGMASKADTSVTTGLQAQIDALVSPATSDSEVQLARVAVDGTTHATLKARIDAEVGALQTGINSKVGTQELLDGYVRLAKTDFDLGYVAALTGEATDEHITCVYTDLLPAGYIADVDTDDIKVAKYSYDETETFVSVSEDVTTPNTAPNGYKTRYAFYWADTGLYATITEARAKDLLPHITVRTTTLTDYKGSNPYVEALDMRKQISATAFVVDRAISWRDDSVCDLKIDANIRLLIGTQTIVLAKEDLYTLADASDVVTLRSDNSIRSYDFALCYDTVEQEFCFRLHSYPYTHSGRFIILFEHYYGSLSAAGLLVESSTTSRIYALEHPAVGGVPDYFATEAATTAASLAAAATEPCYAVIFVTDSHHNNTLNDAYDAWKYTGKNIQYLSTLYQFDAIIHGGDLVSGNISKASTVRLINEIRNELCAANDNVFILNGNHDDNSYKDKTTNYINAAERYGIMHRQSAAKVFSNPNDPENFYYDVPGLGLRVICLNSIVGYGVDSNDTSWGYSNATLAWFRDTALNTTNQVAIFSHMCFSGEFNGYNLYPMNGVEMRGAVDNFVSNGGVCVGLFHGHNHWDNIAKVTGSNLTEVDTACSLCSDSASPVTGGTVPARNLDDVTADCFDCIVIKPASRAVQLIRFGAGNDRQFTY